MQQRIPNIDVIKGIAISLVVGGHVLERGFLFQSGFCYDLYNFIYSFHVPLFFLGSGLLITQKLTYKKIISKTISLLVPFFIVGSIYTLLAPQAEFKHLFFSQGKNGYWFVFTLFEIFLLFFFHQKIISFCQRIFGEKYSILYEICTLSIIITISGGLYIIFSSYHIGDFFAIKRVLAGYHFFIFGYWISNYDNIKYFFNKERVFTCNLILFLILFYISINLYSNELFRTIYRIPITLSIYYIIKNANLSRFTKPFEYLGKNSLSIYLFHYFFIIYISDFTQLLLPFSGNNDIPLIFLILIGYATITIICSLFCNKIISQSCFLSFLLLGKKMHK